MEWFDIYLISYDILVQQFQSIFVQVNNANYCKQINILMKYRFLGSTLIYIRYL